MSRLGSVAGPDHRRRVELPVARVQHDAERGADGERVGLRDRVRDRNELQIERADIEAPVERHLLDRQLQLAAVLGELGFQHRRGEGSCIDRRLQPRPQLDDRAEMVLVRVGEHEAGERRPAPPR